MALYLQLKQAFHRLISPGYVTSGHVKGVGRQNFDYELLCSKQMCVLACGSGSDLSDKTSNWMSEKDDFRIHGAVVPVDLNCPP